MGVTHAAVRAEPIPTSSHRAGPPDLTPMGPRKVLRGSDGVTRTSFPGVGNKTVTIHEGPSQAIRNTQARLSKRYAPDSGISGGRHYDWSSGKLVSWEHKS